MRAHVRCAVHVSSADRGYLCVCRSLRLDVKVIVKSVAILAASPCAAAPDPHPRPLSPLKSPPRSRRWEWVVFSTVRCTNATKKMTSSLESECGQ